MEFVPRLEVQLEGVVRSVAAFSRFLESISFPHGSVLNVSAVSRDCQVERKTVEGYVSILEDLLLAFRVPVFVRHPRCRAGGRAAPPAAAREKPPYR